VHRTGELYGQFKTLEQQKETATLGMWIFLITEVMFFGGIINSRPSSSRRKLPRSGCGSSWSPKSCSSAASC